MAADEQSTIVEKAIEGRKDDGTPLSVMTFAGTRLNDDGLVMFLERDINLEKLYLMHTCITDRGMAAVTRYAPNLTDIDLTGTAVTAQGLAHLANLSHLNKLTLSGRNCEDGGFAAIGKLSGLIDLEVRQKYADPWIHYRRDPGPAIDGRDLANLRHLHNLRRLCLAGLGLQDDDFDWLDGMPLLEEIDLSNTRASKSGLRKLAQAPRLSALQLSNTDVDDECLMALCDALEIRTLGIANTQINDAGIRHLAARGGLENIFAEDVAWTLQTCESLLCIPTLKWAELHVDGISHDELSSVCPEGVWLHP